MCEGVVSVALSTYFSFLLKLIVLSCRALLCRTSGISKRPHVWTRDRTHPVCLKGFAIHVALVIIVLSVYAPQWIHAALLRGTDKVLLSTLLRWELKHNKTSDAFGKIFPFFFCIIWFSTFLSLRWRLK